ncbi:unnamed protein product [Clonostachys byssicola]|uniref:Eukaryotic translation initiation factor 4E type 2 n=1 Tax=Clonostachys byssicola TaxID=160290 RepID=A0A9N9YDW7_9HYPO|nr:unnamed protein product [Clonostachys byssicola]
MENIWARRANTNKLSLTTPNTIPNGPEVFSQNASSARRQGGNTPSNVKPNPFNSTTPGAGVSSPTTAGASSAFGLGSGAFASFGSAKTPKSMGGNPFDTAMASAVSKSIQPKEGQKPVVKAPSMASISEMKRSGDATSHPLKDAWSFWYRPPISKAHGFIEYEQTLHGIATITTGEEFWDIYTHLKRPSMLPVVSDYHLFKRDIRPIWEDEINRKGGKWVVRMKKGVADRYWEDLLLALIGDQFGESGEEVCGAVLSVRNGEDILSIWTKTDGGRVLKIRETMKKILNFPNNTRIDFKSHDSSIQQRTAIDEQRREKANQHHHEKRQPTMGSRQHHQE